MLNFIDLLFLDQSSIFMSKVTLSLDEQIQKLNDKVNQLKAKKQAIESRQKAIDLKKTRADDTRRKILIGAAVLSQCENSEDAKAKTRAMMDKYLTKDADRVLFELSPIVQE